MTKEEKFKVINDYCEDRERCDGCPIHNQNGLCGRILNSVYAEDVINEDIDEAYDAIRDIACLKEENVEKSAPSSVSAWDLMRKLEEKEYQDFKTYVYGDMASTAALQNFMEDFSEKELCEKYKHFCEDKKKDFRPGEVVKILVGKDKDKIGVVIGEAAAFKSKRYKVFFKEGLICICAAEILKSENKFVEFFM